jgi:hypothetical protein
MLKNGERKVTNLSSWLQQKDYIMAPKKKATAQPKKKDGTLAKTPKAEKTLGVFDFITAVSDSKEDLIRKSDSPEAAEKLFNPYMTNRALSYHISSIYEANMMNESHYLDKRLQFDFLLHSVRREKRFSKWFKPEANESLELISKHYNCNLRKAQEILSVLSESQVESIRQWHYTGGAGK